MSKRNISYIKPEDPEFLRVLKKQVGYDDKNHKFDKLQNSEEDFVDDGESEKPQVVVLKPGDLTAEEADVVQKQIDEKEKSDLTKVRFIPRKISDPTESKKSKTEPESKKSKKSKKSKPVLSFDIEEEDL